MTENSGTETAERADDGTKYVPIKHAFVDRFNDDREVAVEVRFRRATPAAAERTQQKMNKKLGAAMRNLCISCVHPDDKQKMLEAFDEYPGLATTFGTAILEAAGFGDLGNG